ncbi:hypothetical protein BUALT_Bualt12G0119200 [Buddleja alternifolia]|uniref:SWIM-type domain-containing protein n=1 Tax=Buddleja alternifolia TaxID=168488 RepID=A0AAV6WS71_9LAMI|nr:hypothetical protein BUALT_Bualt12G0119200 [Buddleja alternifolia]
MLQLCLLHEEDREVLIYLDASLDALSSQVGTFGVHSEYVDAFKTDPKRNVKGFRQDVIKDINVHVSRNQAYRTSYPGSAIILSMTAADGSGTPRFGRFYVCFKGVKDGFLSGCRPIIGVDGCHLKGLHGGLLLATVGIDLNYNSYLICYAVVDKKTKATWEWFLTLLKHDLNIVRDHEWTFMSDKQKGLTPALNTIFPTYDHRFCVMHLFGNMAIAGFKGPTYKKAMWKVAYATTVTEFETKMKEMIKLDKKVVEWLNDKPPMHWSSMLEWIREWMMNRLQESRDKCVTERKWNGKICPKIKEILKKRSEKVRDCIPMKSTNLLYEIECYDTTRCAVDLVNWTCSCTKWELLGIPCKHALSAIHTQWLDPDDFVHPCYHVEIYARVYSHIIYPVNGPEKWKKIGKEDILPPNNDKSVGGPASARRLGADEPSTKQKKATRGNKKNGKIKRQQTSLSCRFCGERWHNRKGCKKRKEEEARMQEEESLIEETYGTNLEGQEQEQGPELESNVQEEQGLDAAA